MSPDRTVSMNSNPHAWLPPVKNKHIDPIAKNSRTSGRSLRIERVSKQYRPGKWVFRGVSMEFHPGEAVLLSGPNGSGKSTFLKLLSLNSYPTEGTVRYGDLEIHRHPWRFLKRVGLVHDEESLPGHLSAVELLEWICRSRGVEADEIERRTVELLDRLDLDEARHQPVATYSTGMRKKVQIAAALVTEPEILILDEPLRGLDSRTIGTVFDLLREGLGRGAILLMASHGEESANTLFHRHLVFPLGNPLPDPEGQVSL